MKTSNKGFTLIELILASALTLLTLSMIYSFMLASYQFFKKNQERADIQGQLRTIMLCLKEEFKTADKGTFFLLKDDLAIDEAINDLSDTNYTEGRIFYYDSLAQKLKKIEYTNPSRDKSVIAFIDFKLPNFEIIFSTNQNYKNIINVLIKSNNIELEGELALLNAEAPEYIMGGNNEYIGVILKPTR